MPPVSLIEFMVACRETDRLSEIWRLTLDFFHSRGIKMVSYHSDDAQEPGAPQLGIVEDGFPEEWVDQYIETKLARIDPIPELAAQMARPFLWSQIADLTDLTPEHQHYLRLMSEAGLGDGLALQVFGPNFRNAYVGLGFGGEAPDLTPQEIYELQCAAQMAHLRYCEITEERRAVAHLSPREQEILRWIAKGKSNSVIAEILGISRHTVDTMTRRMFEKLEVNDRTSAAIRGLGAGLLNTRGPDPL